MKIIQLATDWLGRSLVRRIILQSVLATMFSAMIVGLVGFLMVRALENDTAQNVLFQDIRQAENALTEALHTIGQDLEILTNTPPMQGLVRATVNGGVDPLDTRLTTSDWRAQLASNFAAFQHIRPDYMQIRLIGMADDGREIVRSDQTRDGQIVEVAEARLQSKGQESYYREALLLEAGETYRSAVSWNREDGQIEEPRRAVFRIAAPVFDDSGARFGFIVINVLAVPFTSHALLQSGVERDIVLSSGDDATFLYAGQTGSGELFLNDPQQSWMILQQVTAAVDGTGRSQNQTEVSGAIARFDYLTPSGSDNLIAVMSPSELFQQGSREASQLVLALIFGLTLLSMGFAYVATRAQLAPLNKIGGQFVKTPKLGTRPDLPVHRADEIGQLARSFDNMIGQLILREAMAKVIFDGVSDGMLICDAAGEIEDVNLALAEMLGRPRLSLVGMDLCDVFPEADFDPEEENTLYEWDVEGPSDMTSAEVGFSQIELAHGVFFAGVVRDTSDRKQREIKNHAFVEALQESNSELDTFAHAASHDLKAPLRAIRTLAEWIQADLEDAQTEEMRENFAILYTRIDRMTGLLNDLLQHAKIGRKTADAAEPPVSGEQLRTTITALSHLPEGAVMTFDPGFDAIEIPSMPVQVVLKSLISNALKHAKSDNDLSIHIGVTTYDDVYKFSVTDNGPGIPPQYHDRIFGMFETLKSRDEGGGSGMGLAICQKHVTSQGGSFQVISEGDGTGASFVFTWPRPGVSTIREVLLGAHPKALSA